MMRRSNMPVVELMMCYIPISQEVLEYRRTRTISTDERAISAYRGG